jgi:hypothetical protein
MSGAGTLLSDLEGGDGPAMGGDNDLVQKILADVNGGPSGGQGMPQQLPARANPGYNSGMYAPPPNQGAVGGMAMDSRIPTAHVIGNDHPTPGDFARAMAGLTTGPIAAPAAGQGAPYISAQSMEAPSYEPPKKNLYSRLIDEAKVPFVVGFLFFVFSLPPVRILFAHYVPQLVKATGEFQLLGLLVVSLIVGATFWLLQRVIVPLLSL